MKKYITSVFAIFTVFVTINSVVYCSVNESDLIYIFHSGKAKDISSWKAEWEDGSKSGAKIYTSGKKAFIKGTSEEKPYGVVYKDVEIDFSAYPFLEIKVEETKGKWYIIAGAPEIKGGWMHIQPPMDEKGFFSYNIKDITKLKGIKYVRLQLGVFGKEDSNIESRMAFSELRLSKKAYGKERVIKKAEVIEEEEGVYKIAGEWNDHWGNGAPSDAAIKYDGDIGTITGTSKKISYGVVYKDMEIDFASYTFLEIKVEEVSDKWYIIMGSEKIKGGWTHVQAPTDEKGFFSYNIKDITNFNKAEAVRLQLGVVREKDSNNFGSKMVFSELRLSGKPHGKKKSTEKAESAAGDAGSHNIAGEWNDCWGDGSSSDATIKYDKDGITVTGTSEKQHYGCVYRDIEADFNKYDTIMIDIKSISKLGYAYIILKGDQFEGGYARIGSAIKKSGEHFFNLKDYIKISGKQKFELQLGITTEGKTTGNKGEFFTFTGFRFKGKEVPDISMGEPPTAEPKKSVKTSSEKMSPKFDLVIEGKWADKMEDGSITGATIKIIDGKAIITGNSPNSMFGSVHTDIKINFDESPILKINVLDVTRYWYIIMHHPDLPEGWKRIQYDTNELGVKTYNLKDITGLSGIQQIRLQVGVSTQEEAPTNKGDKVVFSKLTLLEAE
ncbi:MAG: hypothetical protein JW983_09095 [Elusimicrobia bacterium]|nr:hypothetical protein [Elusimicrobiota bacterium]